tara:strand:+ start:433 stop:609 length:177 start_codon:yes stop_codon:yes gene_type:complete
MKGCYIYVLNAPNGTCHRFHLEDKGMGTAEAVLFLSNKGFRLKDIDWMFSEKEIIHEG